MNSLTQTLLKLTCPGVPDIYQGQELWDFSLVDPDNRRPVDFKLRQACWIRCQRTPRGSTASSSATCCSNYRDGRIKLWLTQKLLNFRREHRDLFSQGNYVPLLAHGGKEEHVVAFAGSMAMSASSSPRPGSRTA